MLGGGGVLQKAARVLRRGVSSLSRGSQRTCQHTSTSIPSFDQIGYASTDGQVFRSSRPSKSRSSKDMQLSQSKAIDWPEQLSTLYSHSSRSSSSNSKKCRIDPQTEPSLTTEPVQDGDVSVQVEGHPGAPRQFRRRASSLLQELHNSNSRCSVSRPPRLRHTLAASSHAANRETEPTSQTTSHKSCMATMARIRDRRKALTSRTHMSEGTSRQTSNSISIHGPASESTQLPPPVDQSAALSAAAQSRRPSITASALKTLAGSCMCSASSKHCRGSNASEQAEISRSFAWDDYDEDLCHA